VGNREENPAHSEIFRMCPTTCGGKDVNWEEKDALGGAHAVDLKG